MNADSQPDEGDMPLEAFDELADELFEAYEEEEDDVAAIQAAIDDLEAGEEGMPLEQFDCELRKEFPFLEDLQ